MLHTTFVRLEKEVLADPYDIDPEYIEDNKLEPIGGDCDFWRYEYENCGTPEAWQKILRAMPDGYYEMTFETFLETDFSEGYATHSYECMDEEVLPIFTPAPIRARLLVFKTLVFNWLWRASHLVGNCWEVSVDDGGIGFTRQKMWLPEAVWFRYFGDYSGWFDDYPREKLHRRLNTGHWKFLSYIMDLFEDKDDSSLFTLGPPVKKGKTKKGKIQLWFMKKYAKKK